MEKIMILSEDIINEMRTNQQKILKKLNETKSNDDDHISTQTAARQWDCDPQTITNLAEEGLIQRYGRGKFIRYSKNEIKEALSRENKK